MVRRKGEMSSAQLDREYPHQVLLRADHYTGSAYRTVQAFCIGLSLAPRGHSMFKDDAWHHVFCFSDPVDVKKFRARFGGEVFDARQAIAFPEGTQGVTLRAGA